MSYYGENHKLSFRDNLCEEISSLDIAETTEIGKIISCFFNRVVIGCNTEERNPEMFALAGSIAKGGADVFLIKDCMPILRYAISSTQSDCGIFIGDGERMSIYFFDRYGLKLPEYLMRKIYEGCCNNKSNKIGKITFLNHISELYINDIKDNLSQDFTSDAVVSCGNRNLMKIWGKFFNGCKSDTVFQVSDNGEKVSCYNSELGFISHERLVLAYCMLLWERHEKVILPDNIHYAAEDIAKNMNEKFCYIDDFNRKEVFKQRFLIDNLYMCVKLLSNGKNISEIMKKMPEFYTAKREIFTTQNPEKMEQIVKSKDGKVSIINSGKSRITLLAQSYDAEMAAELCGKWENILKRKSPNTNDFI